MKTILKISPPIFIFHLTVLLLFSYHCDKQEKTKELDEKTFVQVYCDVITYSDLVDSKLRQAFVDSILNSYDISRQEFQQTVESYSRNEKKWEKIFTKIVEELEKREKEIAAKNDSTAVIKSKQIN